MPDPEKGAIKRLDKRLDALEAQKAARPALLGRDSGASEGYRLLGRMLGGVLGGIGIGWLVDRFAHTGPWGIVGGLLIGAGLSIYAVARSASAISDRAAKSAAAAPARDDDEDDT
jgi:ATP synthase protein I